MRLRLQGFFFSVILTKLNACLGEMPPKSPAARGYLAYIRSTRSMASILLLIFFFMWLQIDSALRKVLLSIQQ